MAGKGKFGPPLKVAGTVLSDLERALGWGWSIASSCEYAGIGEATFYAAQKRDPGLKRKIEMIRSRPELAARRNLAESIEEGDIATSKWFLERRTSDFNPKTQVDVTTKKEVDELSVIAALQRLIALSQKRAAAGVLEGAAG